jgi:hypothetical protein
MLMIKSEIYYFNSRVLMWEAEKAFSVRKTSRVTHKMWKIYSREKFLFLHRNLISPESIERK